MPEIAIIGDEELLQFSPSAASWILLPTMNTPYGPATYLYSGRITYQNANNTSVTVDVVLARRDKASTGSTSVYPRVHTEERIETEVPYRAIIYAFKQMGVKYLFSVAHVGRLKESVQVNDIYLPDQFIDYTKNRGSPFFGSSAWAHNTSVHNIEQTTAWTMINLGIHRGDTFFGDGAVAHVSMSEPVCPSLAYMLDSAYRKVKPNLRNRHKTNEKPNIFSTGTSASIDGPALPTYGETTNFKLAGCSIMSMTDMPEAKLAKEAEIAYATLGLVTEEDCSVPYPLGNNWTEKMKTRDDIREINFHNARMILIEAVKRCSQLKPDSLAHKSLDRGLRTPVSAMSAATRARLAPIIARLGVTSNGSLVTTKASTYGTSITYPANPGPPYAPGNPGSAAAATRGNGIKVDADGIYLSSVWTRLKYREAPNMQGFPNTWSPGMNVFSGLPTNPSVITESIYYQRVRPAYPYGYYHITSEYNQATNTWTDDVFTTFDMSSPQSVKPELIYGMYSGPIPAGLAPATNPGPYKVYKSLFTGNLYAYYTLWSYAYSTPGGGRGATNNPIFWKISQAEYNSNGTTPTAPVTPAVIDVFGDSISRGYGITKNLVDTNSVLEPTWNFINRSANGVTLKAVRFGYAESYPGAPASEFPLGPMPPFGTVAKAGKYTVIAVGLNDAMGITYPQVTFTAQDFEVDLRAVVNRAIDEGRIPIITGLPNINWQSQIFAGRNTQVRDKVIAFNNVCAQVATSLNCKFANFNSAYNSDARNTIDGIHPTQENSNKLAALLRTAIKNSIV
jgi:5'-methylthioadenosine phosphorylase